MLIISSRSKMENLFNTLSSYTWPDSFKGWLIVILPWVLSLFTVLVTYLTGKKHNLTWVIGLFSQVLWSIWIIISKTYELIPVNLTLWVLYYRNHLLWKRDSLASQATARITSTDQTEVARLI